MAASSPFELPLPFGPGGTWRNLLVKEKEDHSDDPEISEQDEKDASNLDYPSPVPAETVYLIMSKNFPPKAISWVRRAKWQGPVYVPWNQIDTENKRTWAASHQPERVKDFQKQIKAHDGHVAPSILVRQKNGGKSFIVDGHHRALAREELGQDVLAYVGRVDSDDYLAATETHAQQIHSGSDPQNR